MVLQRPIVNRLSAEELARLVQRILEHCTADDYDRYLNVPTKGHGFSQNRKGYSQLASAVALPGGSYNSKTPHLQIPQNTKFQVHHIMGLHVSRLDPVSLVASGFSPDDSRIFQKYFAERGLVGSDWYKYELSHRCNNKQCANPHHYFPEPSAVNKSRNFCEVLVKVNGKKLWCCRHKPRCIPIRRAVRRAFNYQIKTRTLPPFPLYHRFSRRHK
jgi:hypothetical protein